jgi:APA family basic amino acid/polyamine antiporter
LRSFGVDLPTWLTTGYRTALLSPDPALHGLLDGAPHVVGVPLLVNVPAFAIVALITWLLMLGVRESATANNIMVTIKLLVLALFIAVGLTHINPANYQPFAPNGFRGIHQGAAIVFFAYIGFDAISTAAEETKNPQRNLPIGILGGLAICTVIYVIVGAVLTGMVPYTELGVADPLAKALNSAGFHTVGWIVALGAIVSMAAVLLVFQYGQPRIFYAMARDGLLPQWAAKLHPKYRVPHVTTLVTGIFVALWALIGDAGETYDLTNIGTLFAFALVAIGVLVLRYKDRDRPRPFRVPFVWPISLTATALCVFVMVGLPRQAWERFAVWLVLGIAIYAAYGIRHSRLRRPPHRPSEAPHKNRSRAGAGGDVRNRRQCVWCGCALGGVGRRQCCRSVGRIFLRLLIMTVVPLVFASITLGIAGLGDIRRVGRVGARTIVYFLVSTAVAATVGLLLVNLIRPGKGSTPPCATSS